MHHLNIPLHLKVSKKQIHFPLKARLLCALFVLEEVRHAPNHLVLSLQDCFWLCFSRPIGCGSMSSFFPVSYSVIPSFPVPYHHPRGEPQLLIGNIGKAFQVVCLLSSPFTLTHATM